MIKTCQYIELFSFQGALMDTGVRNVYLSVQSTVREIPVKKNMEIVIVRINNV